MKSFVIQITFIILFVLVQTAFAQEKPKAYKIAELGNEPCGGFLANLNIYLREIKSNPGSTGYAVIYGKADKQFVVYEELIDGQMYVSKFDPKRLVVKRAEKGRDDDGISLEFWMVPENAEPPLISEIKNPYLLTSSAKAFRLSTTFYDICPAFSPKLFAEYLRANDNYRGHVVIFNNSIKQARNDGEDFVNTLAKEYEIPKSRVKVFYDTSRVITDSQIELWLVPQKRK